MLKIFESGGLNLTFVNQINFNLKIIHILSYIGGRVFNLNIFKFTVYKRC